MKRGLIDRNQQLNANSRRANRGTVNPIIERYHPEYDTHQGIKRKAPMPPLQPPSARFDARARHQDLAKRLGGVLLGDVPSSNGGVPHRKFGPRISSARRIDTPSRKYFKRSGAHVYAGHHRGRRSRSLQHKQCRVLLRTSCQCVGTNVGVGQPFGIERSFRLADPIWSCSIWNWSRFFIDAIWWLHGRRSPRRQQHDRFCTCEDSLRPR